MRNYKQRNNEKQKYRLFSCFKSSQTCVFLSFGIAVHRGSISEFALSFIVLSIPIQLNCQGGGEEYLSAGISPVRLHLRGGPFGASMPDLRSSLVSDVPRRETPFEFRDNLSSSLFTSSPDLSNQPSSLLHTCIWHELQARFVSSQRTLW